MTPARTRIQRGTCTQNAAEARSRRREIVSAEPKDEAAPRPMQNGYATVTWLLLRGRRIESVTNQEAPMKPSLLIFSAVAIVIAAVAASSSVAGRSGAVLPGFRSPSGNIKCYYNPKGLSSRGFTPVLRCSLDHADYGVTLQHRCETGDWHGFTL